MCVQDLLEVLWEEREEGERSGVSSWANLIWETSVVRGQRPEEWVILASLKGCHNIN